jgi:hypothetical protein
VLRTYSNEPIGPCWVIYALFRVPVAAHQKSPLASRSPLAEYSTHAENPDDARDERDGDQEPEDPNFCYVRSCSCGVIYHRSLVLSLEHKHDHGHESRICLLEGNDKLLGNADSAACIPLLVKSHHVRVLWSQISYQHSAWFSASHPPPSTPNPHAS